MSRRNTELLLLIASAFPVILLYAMYVLTAGATISFETLAVPIGLFAAFAAAHIAVRILAPGADPAILPIVFVLSGIGITFVTRLAPDLAISQLIILFVSVALMVGTLALVKNLDVVMRYKYTFGIIGIILLMLPIFIGTTISGSKLWIRIAGFTIQPGEFAKVFIVLFLAGYLAENRELLSISNRKIDPKRTMVINGLAEALLTTPEWLTGLSDDKEYDTYTLCQRDIEEHIKKYLDTVSHTVKGEPHQQLLTTFLGKMVDLYTVMTCYFADAMEEVDRVAEDKGLKESLGRYAIESGAIMEQVYRKKMEVPIEDMKRFLDGILHIHDEGRTRMSMGALFGIVEEAEERLSEKENSVAP